MKPHSHPILRDGVFEHEPIAARIINRHVSENARMVRGGGYPIYPAVTEKHCRRGLKVQQRSHKLGIVVPVNNIRNRPNGVQVIHHGHRGAP
jgi:hypothetical protein